MIVILSLQMGEHLFTKKHTRRLVVKFVILLSLNMKSYLPTEVLGVTSLGAQTPPWLGQKFGFNPLSATLKDLEIYFDP